MLFATTLDPTRLLGADFFNFLLPWVFTFAVVYGLLDKLEIFGELKSKVNMALSLIIAFFVTGAAGPQMAAFFMSILGNFVVVVAGILVLVIFLSMVGKTKMQDVIPAWAVLIGTLVIGALLFFSAGGFIPGLKIDSNTATLLFWGIILLVAVWWVKGK